MTIIISIKRFLDTLSLLYKDIYAGNKRTAIKILAFSFLGPTMQLGSLVMLLVIFREKNRHIDLIKHYFGEDIYLIVCTLVVLLMLSLSAYLIYESDKMVARLSCLYTNKMIGLLFSDTTGSFRYQISDKKVSFTELFAKCRKLSLYIELASRQSLGIPNILLSFIYSIIILFSINIYLTLILALTSLFLFIPLQSNTKKIILQENIKIRQIREAAPNFKSFLEQDATRDSFGLFNNSNNNYQNTTLSEINKSTRERLVLSAKSKAFVNSLFVFAIAISVLYVITSNEISSNVITSYAVFFIALRASLINGRSIVIQLTTYSRYYPYINDFIKVFIKTKQKSCTVNLNAPARTVPFTLNITVDRCAQVFNINELTPVCIFSYQVIDYVLLSNIEKEIMKLMDTRDSNKLQIIYLNYDLISELIQNKETLYASISNHTKSKYSALIIDGRGYTCMNEIDRKSILEFCKSNNYLLMVIFDPRLLLPIFTNFTIFCYMNEKAAFQSCHSSSIGIDKYSAKIQRMKIPKAESIKTYEYDESYLIQDEG